MAISMEAQVFTGDINAQTHSVTYPGTVTVGARLVCITFYNGSVATPATSDTVMSLDAEYSTNINMLVFTGIATASLASTTWDFTTGFDRHCRSMMWSFPEGDVVTIGDEDTAASVTSCDIASLTPDGGSMNRYHLACVGRSPQEGNTAEPTGYTVSENEGGNVVSNFGHKATTGSSDDPGVYTFDNAGPWVGANVAVNEAVTDFTADLSKAVAAILTEKDLAFTAEYVAQLSTRAAKTLSPLDMTFFAAFLAELSKAEIAAFAALSLDLAQTEFIALARRGITMMIRGRR